MRWARPPHVTAAWQSIRFSGRRVENARVQVRTATAMTDSVGAYAICGLESGRPATIDAVFFSNVASAIKREVWERFPFDPELIMSEDQKWARQVLEAGLDIVYEPAAQVLHSHHYTLGELFRRNFDSGYSLVGVVEDRLAGMIRYEARYLAGGIRALASQRPLRWIPSLLLRELVRASGFACGQRGSWLPLRLRRRLSQHPAHWDSLARSSRR